MYVPPYNAVVKSLGVNADEVEKMEKVAVPAKLLKFLLQLAVASGDFDEEGYLKANPDVRQAVRRGKIESGHAHYIGFGYFEGRKGGAAVFEEDWYLKKYPDVAAAIRSGRIRTALDHFYNVGAVEGRSPNSNQQNNALQWKAAMRGESLERIRPSM
jgi:hypothetical protein